MKSLLNYCRLGWEDIFWTNLFKCVFDENKVPTKKEYKLCLENQLNIQIESLKPKLIVALGSQVYETLFPRLSKHFNHNDFIGDISFYKDTKC